MSLNLQKIVWLLCLSTVAYAEECEKGPKHFRVATRYTTPQGIGYNHGYTTLEGFFSLPRSQQEFLPFLDLRGHIFDNGKFAANAGTGLRYLADSRLWGIYTFYDYRDTSSQHYNQASAGLETLGKIWDFRINGYLPWGKKEVIHHAEFYSFQNHSMILNRKSQFAMKGANAEAGFHWDRFKQAPLYFTAGPYYLTGSEKTTWGGSFRASTKLFEYVTLEANTAYDHFFKWTGQGQIGLNFSFGGKARVKPRANHSCAKETILATRAVQKVDRNEIIPVGIGRHNLSTAIDPATNAPYYFVFVDNTSSSLGTYESPYPNLQQAQAAASVGDTIYVFPGNGNPYDTSYGEAIGMMLQDSQLLLGASTAHSFSTTRGSISIPPQASSLPVITNSQLASSFAIVTLANNNTVSGFQWNNTSSGSDVCYCISGSNISNLTATQNTFTGGIGTDSTFPAGMHLADAFGTIVIDSSTFDNVGSGFGYGILAAFGSSSASTLMDVSNSTFTCATTIDAGEGSALGITNGDLGNTVVNLTNLNASGFQGGIAAGHGTLNGGGNNYFTINIIDSQVSGALELGVSITNNSDHGLLTANVTGSSINNNGTCGLNLANNGNFDAPFSFETTNSQFNDNASVAGNVNDGAGIFFITGNGPCFLSVARSQANGNGASTGGTINGCYGMGVQNFGEAVTLNISNSQFNGNGAPEIGGTVNNASGLNVSNNAGAIGAITVTLSGSELNGNGISNGGTVTGTNAGLVLSNTETVFLTVSGMTGTSLEDNKDYGIFGTATTPGTTTVDYTGASFSGSETATNRDVPGNNVTWINN